MNMNKLRESDNLTLYSEFKFYSAHRLFNKKLSYKDNRKLFGECSNFYGHGHAYYLIVGIKGQPCFKSGMIMNFKDLKQIVNKQIIKVFDHHFINKDTPNVGISTAENLVRWIWNKLKRKLPSLCYLRLYETDNNSIEKKE